MNRHQEIVFALAGQSFIYDVPEGRPDAAPAPAVQVFLSTNSDTTGAEVATTGSVTIDAVDTTIATTPALAQDQALTVASGASIARNRRYILTGPDGNNELVEIVGINGTAVTLRRPLLNGYAIGSKLQGRRIMIGVDPTWVNNQAKISDILGVTWRTDREPRTDWLAGYAGYRLRWTYSIGGVPAMGFSFADLVRYASKNLVNPLDIDSRFPGWIDRLPTDYQHDQGATLVAEAFRALKIDAMGDNQALRRIRNTEIVAELVVARANMLMAENAVLAGGGAEARIAYDLSKSVYTELYNRLLREPKFQVDQTSGGESAQARRLPVFRR